MVFRAVPAALLRLACHTVSLNSDRSFRYDRNRFRYDQETTVTGLTKVCFLAGFVTHTSLQGLATSIYIACTSRHSYNIHRIKLGTAPENYFTADAMISVPLS